MVELYFYSVLRQHICPPLSLARNIHLYNFRFFHTAKMLNSYTISSLLYSISSIGLIIACLLILIKTLIFFSEIKDIYIYILTLQGIMQYKCVLQMDVKWYKTHLWCHLGTHPVVTFFLCYVLLSFFHKLKVIRSLQQLYLLPPL